MSRQGRVTILGGVTRDSSAKRLGPTGVRVETKTAPASTAKAK
jgi:hypothetical protein